METKSYEVLFETVENGISSITILVLVNGKPDRVYSVPHYQNPELLNGKGDE